MNTEKLIPHFKKRPWLTASVALGLAGGAIALTLDSNDPGIQEPVLSSMDNWRLR